MSGTTSSTTATSTQTQNSNITPNWDAKATIFSLGMITENIVDLDFAIDFNLTLNNKLGFAANTLPTAPRKMRYFCIGNGGMTVGSDNLAEAYRVSGLDGMPFGIMPIRAVPFEEDLSADERDRYAGRVVTQRKVNGVTQQYVFYYLKAFDKVASQISFVRNDSQSKTMVPYVPTVDCMSPTPLVPDNNGTITDVADTISTQGPVGLTILGSEVLEVINVLYGGDPRYANVSEIGIVGADVQTLTVTDANNNSFPYKEAIAAQLMTHSTNAGTSITGPSQKIQKTINLAIQNVNIVIS